MSAVLEQVRNRLGAGWEMYWGYPPKGVYLLKEEYLSDPSSLTRQCGRDGLVVVYIAAVAGDFAVVYGRVKPHNVGCPVATFVKEFNRSEVRTAVRALVEYATAVDKIPVFQINPEVLRFAGLCDEYPVVCEEPEAVVKRLENREPEKSERSQAAASRSEWVLGEVLRVLSDLVERDPIYVEVLKKVVENPEKLKECYD
ncbi:hypothetical protein [Pyrobaculum sp.]|uniref:hypothetical protein n=1 Tax=Pyrobaculum sp. TaxID=2004705 RepID=UPI00317527A8